MKLYIISVLLLFVQLHETRELFISYSTEWAATEFFKYFHSTKNQFFVDVGANEPIYDSKTVNLLGWDGLNIEADTQKHMNFIVSRPHQTNLNMFISDSSNGVTQSKVQKITLADLCHQYYPKRPKFMILAIPFGQVMTALNSNDWKDIKCQPQVIATWRLLDPTDNKNLREFLIKRQYSFQKVTQKNQVYVKKQLIPIYRQLQEKSQILMRNIIVKEWIPLYSQLFRVIVPQYDANLLNFRHIDPRTSPLYIHFASQQVISVQKLKTTSQILSKNTRPILITHFNNLKSKLYLGIQNYKITEIKLNSVQAILYHIQIKYPEQKVQLYVLDHDLSRTKLNILDRQLEQAIRCPDQKNVIHQKVVNSDNYIGG